MDKNYFIKLLKKSHRGNLTNEEQQFLSAYYNLFENEPDVMSMLGHEEKSALKSGIRQSIRNRIAGAEQEPPRVRFIERKILRLTAAAVLFIVISAGSLLLLLNRSDKVGAGTLAAHHTENRIIFLPDGSTVILSPGSHLDYPKSFDGLSSREVALEGQAFFDIKHNVSKPFIVYTGKVKTKVLGTAFNIKAIPEDADITVTVTRGKVQVADEKNILGVITPNQQIVYSKEEVTAVTKMVNSKNLLTWRDQDLLCDNLSIKEAAELLQERFDVKIVLDSQLTGSRRFTTTFPKDEDFEQILKSICVFNNLSYTYDKKNSIVIIK